MNRIDRLTGTILLLQSHRAITAEQIASHWEISLRTVYRDLAALTEAGVPLWFCPNHKGYRLMDGFHLPPVQFTDQEATALFVAGAVTNTIADTSLQQAHASALLKIREYC
ncbi:MAG: HTH domain-containing protein [Marinobacter sp.]|nr:HTH domain-containing protein [Marinobacter sp.]